MKTMIRCEKCGKALFKAKELDAALKIGLEIEVMCTHNKCKNINTLKQI